MQEKDHVINVLEHAKKAIKNHDVLTLKSLSNQTIHMISIYKDTDNISIAVIIYSIAKLIEKDKNKKMQGCSKFCNHAMIFLDKAIHAIKKENHALLKESLESITDSIKKLSPELKSYVTDIFNKAKINKASKIYEHGISLEQTAKIFGITLWDVASYAAQSPTQDKSIPRTVDPLERIKIVESIFNTK